MANYCPTVRVLILMSVLAVVMSIRKEESEMYKFSTLRPDPAALVWVHTPVKGEVSKGILTVKLDPSDNDSPSLQLEVRMQFAKTQPAPLGPILVHCGGPGSTSTCVGFGRKAQFEGYDVWAISQRGMGETAKPALLCGNSYLPTKCPREGCQIRDFTDCPCALLDGTPQIGEIWADIDPVKRNEVRNLLQHMKDWGQKCYSSPKFQLVDKLGRKYNFLDYIGTQFLAYDIDSMRKAIGAQKMSVVGFSYGTYVAGVYATVFSEFVGRVVLDGNMDPFPQKQNQALGDARANDKAIAKLLLNCEQQPRECPLKHPEAEYQAVVASARAGNLSARTKSGMKFKLTVGMLMAYLQNEYSDNTGEGFKTAVYALSKLSPKNKKKSSRTAVVADILNGYCMVKGRPTWYNYDICVGPGQTSEDEGASYAEPYLEQCAIWGVDQAGLSRVQDAMGFWQSKVLEKSDAGIAAIVGDLAGYSFWPATATPTPPIGNPLTPALVIGNLFDTATSYSWAQEMRKAFPSGSLLTWQGVGHCLPDALSSYDRKGIQKCQDRVYTYLQNGELPRDGFLCKQNEVIPIS